MIHLLAQTTQHDHGMSEWGPKDWAIFFGGLTTFFTAAVIPSIIAWRKSNANAQDVQTLAKSVSPEPNSASVDLRVEELKKGKS